MLSKYSDFLIEKKQKCSLSLLINEGASLVLGIKYVGEKKIWETFEYVSSLEQVIDLEELELKSRELRSKSKYTESIDRLLKMLSIY